MKYSDVYTLLFNRNSNVKIGDYVVLTYDEQKNYVMKDGLVTVSKMVEIATDKEFDEVADLIYNNCTVDPDDVILCLPSNGYTLAYSVGNVIGLSDNYVLVSPGENLQSSIREQGEKKATSSFFDINPCVDGSNAFTTSIDSLRSLLIEDHAESENKETKTEEKEKEETRMFSEMGTSFGKLNSDQFRLSINGLAVRGKDGKYLTFNPETRELVEISNGFFDDMKDLLFVMPATELEVGDIILHQNNKPYYITSIDNGEVKGIDFEEAVENTFIPKTNVFGIKYYTKVFNCLGTNNILGTDLASNPVMAYALMGGKDFDLSKIMMFQAMTGKGKGISDLSENPMMLMALMGNESGNGSLSDFAKMQILSQMTAKTKKKEKTAKEDKAN